VLSQHELIIHTIFLLSPASYNSTNGLIYASMTPEVNYSIALDKLWENLVAGLLFDAINILSTLLATQKPCTYMWGYSLGMNSQ
jgi:hypothetical protein